MRQPIQRHAWSLGWRHPRAVALAVLACAATAPGAALARDEPVATVATEEVPRLGHNQIETARRVTRSDTSLTRLFHGTGYRVAHLGPWSTGGERNRLIGVVFFVDLDHPVTVAGLWPTAVYEPKKPFPSYSEHHEYSKVVRLRSVIVEVDLQRRAVEGVRPGDHG